MTTLNAIKKTFLATSIILSLGTVSTARAADFDFAGTFSKDNDVLFFDFSIASNSDITIFSSSWDDGGFDPILAIWDSSGNLIAQQDDGGLTGTEFSNGVEYSYGVWDSYFTQSLTAGSYKASVAQFSNFALGTNLSDGFQYDGAGNENFTAGFGCTNGQFCGVFADDDNRANQWVFHILNVDQAVVVDPPVSTPEPFSLFGLLGVDAFGASLKVRKKTEF